MRISRIRAAVRGLWTLSFLLTAGLVGAEDRPSTGSRARAEIRDEAGMFGDAAVARARTQLERIASEEDVPVVIETIEKLASGQSIESAAVARARAIGGEGIYILASRRDRHLEVLVSKSFLARLPESKRAAIRQAFTEGFRQGDYDRGLLDGVAMIAKVLTGENSAGKAARVPAHDGDSSPLVLRNQVRLTLAGAERILAAARAKAAEMGLKMNIAVVDEGGHPVAFVRMDGARPASGYTATTKAVTAATFRAPTGPVPTGTTTPDPLLNLSLQNAALASGGKITTLLGGVPVVVEEQVIGGVGVGGGSGEQDATVARAGIDAFLAGLKEHAEKPAEAPPVEK